ncbi:hypothetical protein [Bradyrhizobium sp. URHC0002]
MLDYPFGFEQHRVLLERGDLEIRLKSLEVVLAELVEQKVFHSALLRDRRERKELSAIGALMDTR